MTPLRKTCICLTLLTVLAALTGRGDGGSAPPAATTVPTSAAAQPGRTIRSTGSANSYATPARYPDWASLESDDEDLVGGSPLVIPGKELNVEAAGQIIEDLRIMGRIIEKNVLDNYGARRSAYGNVLLLATQAAQDMGPRVLFPSVGRPKPLYIAGYGAAFFIQVDFPLLPPPEAKQDQPAEAQGDPVWSQTRRSLLEPPSAGTTSGRDDAAASYSQGKVDSLKRSLIATMKHAANIRVLESKEWLTIVVQGTGPSSGSPTAGRSVISLRATKADLDLYAKGQLSQTQFQERVQVVTY